jgi:hypothetical protein
MKSWCRTFPDFRGREVARDLIARAFPGKSCEMKFDIDPPGFESYHRLLKKEIRVLKLGQLRDLPGTSSVDVSIAFRKR